MNIEQVIQKSKEYHGSLPPKTQALTEYMGESKYMCAVGCNLNNPKALEKYAHKANAYSITGIIDSFKEEFADYPKFDYSEEPLLVEALRNPEFLDQLNDLQSIHDACICVEDYLEALENFEAKLGDNV